MLGARRAVSGWRGAPRAAVGGADPPRGDGPAAGPAPRTGLRWLCPAAVAAWTLLAFLPVLRNEFVNWDDVTMFPENPRHRGPLVARVGQAWREHVLGEYMPVTWSSYALDGVLWDLHAPGYHLTNLLLHVGAALAVYALARRLLAHALGAGDGTEPDAILVGATAAALAFAVHPLRAEPVAWIAARGTVLGGLLAVLATLVYVAGWERARPGGGVPARWLAGSLALFAASLLARATGLVLPAALLVLDVYPLRRLAGSPPSWLRPAARRVWLEKAAFGLIAALAIPMGFLARGADVGGFWRTGWDPPIALATAVYGAAFYLWKTLTVGVLSPIYPMPARHAPMRGAVLLSALALGVITAVLLAARRRWPGALAAWLAYAILLAPMSGIVPFGRLRGAVDRYTYLACVGWAVVAGGGLALGMRRWRAGRLGAGRAAVLGAAALAVLAGWSVLSWQQSRVWRDSVSLWTHALRAAPESPLVHTNLGTALAARREFGAAERHYAEALRAWPANPGALQNLGRALAAQGRADEAAAAFRRAVALRPGWADVHLDLGRALVAMGQLDEAIGALRRAVELDPGSARAHAALGLALGRAGRAADGAPHLRRAAELDGGADPAPRRSW